MLHAYGMAAQLRGGTWSHDHGIVIQQHSDRFLRTRTGIGLPKMKKHGLPTSWLAAPEACLPLSKKSPHLHGARWMGIKHGQWERASDHGGCPILPKLAPLGHFLEG